jgi:TonB-dependent receptor
MGAATGSGSISGTVKDPSGAVLPGSQIVLEPGSTTTAANAQGNFVLQNLKPGSYTVTISAVGFATSVSTVVVNAGAGAVVNATLKLSSNSEQVIVNGGLEGDVAAINEQRTSENILNVMTAETIQNLPNQSVATVLGRMPGVTVQINEGEAQYVQIRGTEPRLSNTTIDGVSVPGPDPQVRQVDLWVIPGDLVGAIDINKTLSANQDGDAIGGSVNLHMRQATSNRPTLDIESLGGFNPIDTGQPWFRDDATIGKRFGAHQRFGAIFSFSYDLNDLGTDDVEPLPDVNPDGSNAPYFDTIALNEYFYNHTRYGFGGSMDTRCRITPISLFTASSQTSRITARSSSTTLVEEASRSTTACAGRTIRSPISSSAVTRSSRTLTSTMLPPSRTRAKAEQRATPARTTLH